VIASTLPATVRNQRSSSTDFLIRLQQHPGRRRHEHYGHHKEEAGECGNHPEDDHPYTVSSTERVRDGTLRGSGAHSHVGLSENKHIRSGRCVPQPIAGPDQAGAKTTLPTIGTGHAAIETS
jgi:hypothetical protein